MWRAGGNWNCCAELRNADAVTYMWSELGRQAAATLQRGCTYLQSKSPEPHNMSEDNTCFILTTCVLVTRFVARPQRFWYHSTAVLLGTESWQHQWKYLADFMILCRYHHQSVSTVACVQSDGFWSTGMPGKEQSQGPFSALKILNHSAERRACSIGAPTNKPVVKAAMYRIARPSSC